MARKKEEKSYFNLGDDWKVANVRDLEFGLFFTLQLRRVAQQVCGVRRLCHQPAYT